MVLVCFLWGANFSITKIGLLDIPPLGFTALRFLAASVLLWLVVRVKEGPLKVPPGSLGKLIWLGVVGNTVYQLGFILGLDHTSATHSALILSTVPTVVAIMAGLLRLEPVTARVGWGIAVATLGVVLVVALRGSGLAAGSLSGDLLTGGAVLCWSAYTLGLRTLPAGISPLRITAITMLTGTPGLVLAGLPDLFHLRWGAVGPAAWGALAYAAIGSLVIAYVLWNSSVRVVGSSRTAVYMCLTPIIAVAIAWVLLGEVPAPIQGVGAVLVIAGVWMSRR